MVTHLAYTLAFIRFRGFGEDMTLMLHRNNPPNQWLYNGVGGKLYQGETPRECVLREIAEETQLTISNLRFGGVVTWNMSQDGSGRKGMYVYTADWDQKFALNMQQFGPRPTAEGTLLWMPTSWCCAPNLLLVDNIPHFLPHMLEGRHPSEFYCRYGHDGKLVGVKQLPLSAEVIDLATKEEA